MAFLCALAASFLFPTTGLSNGFDYLPALPSSEWLFNSRCYLLQDGCASIDERHLWSSTATCVEILASEMGVRPLDNPVPIRITYVFGRFFERNVFLESIPLKR